jgi:hypothetical protein
MSMDNTNYPAVFVPLDASAPRLSLDLTPHDNSRLSIQDVHLGLVLLHPNTRGTQLPDILVVDPASRRQVQFPPPPPFPYDAPPPDGVCGARCFIGTTVLARAHASSLTFDVVRLIVDGGCPRVCVASVLDDNFASWRALLRAQGVIINFDLDP